MLSYKTRFIQTVVVFASVPTDTTGLRIAEDAAAAMDVEARLLGGVMRPRDG